MNNQEIKTVEKLVKSVTFLAIIIDTVLFILKIIIGLLAGSIALVADGVHSLSDLTTDFAAAIGYYFGSKKPDESHQYGHGKVETFSAIFIAFVLAIVGVAMIYYAVIDIAKKNVTKPSISVIIAAFISIVVKESLYRITKKAAVKSHSPSLYANAWHHRSDAASSVAVLVGCITLFAGFRYGDQFAAVAVGVMITYVAAKIISSGISELAESAIDQDTARQIKNIINQNPTVKQWHKLRTRKVGRQIFLDLHILVDPKLNVTEAHQISEKLENDIQKKITKPVNIIIHIEPDIPALRK